MKRVVVFGNAGGGNRRSPNDWPASRGIDLSMLDGRFGVAGWARYAEVRSKRASLPGGDTRAGLEVELRPTRIWLLAAAMARLHRWPRSYERRSK